MGAARSRWIYITLSIVVGFAVLAILIARRKPLPTAAAPKEPVAARVETANELTLQGKIRPQHVVGVGASVPGFIESFLVEPGQDVYEGQALARIGAQGLESTREAAQIALERAQEKVTRLENAVTSARMESSRADADAQRAQLALDRAEKVFTRQRTLHEAGATPRLSYEKALADYSAAQKEYDIMSAASRAGRSAVQAALNEVAAARKTIESKNQELAEAQDNLTASEVHSPVDGYVIGRKGEPGQRAEDFGSDFFQIATDLFALEVELEPKAADLAHFIPGMPALVLVLDVQSSAMEGKVKEIKDGKVIVEFGSANPAIKPNMLADVRFRW
jgi:multidrug resistance efflux pump